MEAKEIIDSLNKSGWGFDLDNQMYTCMFGKDEISNGSRLYLDLSHLDEMYFTVKAILPIEPHHYKRSVVIKVLNNENLETEAGKFYVEESSNNIIYKTGVFYGTSQLNTSMIESVLISTGFIANDRTDFLTQEIKF